MSFMVLVMVMQQVINTYTCTKQDCRRYFNRKHNTAVYPLVTLTSVIKVTLTCGQLSVSKKTGLLIFQ